MAGFKRVTYTVATHIRGSLGGFGTDYAAEYAVRFWYTALVMNAFSATKVTKGRTTAGYYSFAYSALASSRMMSGRVFPESEEPLLRQSNPAQQIGIARIGVEKIKTWFRSEIHHVGIARLIPLLQPRQRMVFLTETGIHFRYAEG